MLLLLHALIPCVTAYILHLFLYILALSSLDLHPSTEMFLYTCCTDFSLYTGLKICGCLSPHPF